MKIDELPGEVKPINLLGSDQLKKVAKKCPIKIDDNGQFNWDEDIRYWAGCLLKTASSEPRALGLAMNQIWDKEDEPYAMFVINTLGSGWKLFINPEITLTGAKIPVVESCLSDKTQRRIKRRQNVTIKYQDLTNTVELQEKIMGRVSILPFAIQHEYDHLQGILTVDLVNKK